MKKLNKKSVVLSHHEFKEAVKETVVHPWEESGCGVAQGLPVSGVFANIYMLEFDERIESVAKKVSGLYMRYSDDFIISAPTVEGYKELLNAVKNCDIPGVQIHPGKTFEYYCERGVVKKINSVLDSCGTTSEGALIDYLGFCFDGGAVRMRQSTVGRYYRQSYRRVRKVFGSGERPSKKRVQRLYAAVSDWGRKPRHNCETNRRWGGNFLTYAHRASRVFENDPILNDVKRHKRKMRARSQQVLLEAAVRKKNDDM